MINLLKEQFIHRIRPRSCSGGSFLHSPCVFRLPPTMPSHTAVSSQQISLGFLPVLAGDSMRILHVDYIRACTIDGTKNTQKGGTRCPRLEGYLPT